MKTSELKKKLSSTICKLEKLKIDDTKKLIPSETKIIGHYKDYVELKTTVGTVFIHEYRLRDFMAKQNERTSPWQLFSLIVNARNNNIPLLQMAIDEISKCKTIKDCDSLKRKICINGEEDKKIIKEAFEATKKTIREGK